MGGALPNLLPSERNSIAATQVHTTSYQTPVDVAVKGPLKKKRQSETIKVAASNSPPNLVTSKKVNQASFFTTKPSNSKEPVTKHPTQVFQKE